MKQLDQYFTDRPLKDDFDDLCDPQLSFEQHREDVNDLTINLVIKYLAAYLEVAHGDILEMRDKIRDLVKNRKRLDGEAAIDAHYCGDNYTDHLAVKCLADIRQTAAIFKEVAFNDQFSSDKIFHGLDLGSGTGILTLALAIAARRKEMAEYLCIGVEVKEIAFQRSREVLKPLLRDNVEVLQKNLTEGRTTRKLLKKYPPSYWVSETISDTTPSLILDSLNFGVIDSYRKQSEKMHDPFVELLLETVKYNPKFFDKVNKGEIAMFPDPVRRLYFPGRDKSTLALRTGRSHRGRLYEVGKEFECYETLDDTFERWVAPRKQKKPSIEEEPKPPIVDERQDKFDF